MRTLDGLVSGVAAVFNVGTRSGDYVTSANAGDVEMIDTGDLGVSS